MELLPTLKSGAFNNSTHLLFFGFWGRDECQRDTDAAADFPPLCRLLQPQLVGIVEWWTIWSNNPIRFSFVRQTLETRPFRNLHWPLPHRAFTAHSTDFRSISAMFKHVQPFSRFLAKQQLELTGLLVVRTQGRRPAFYVIYPLSSARCSLSH